MLKYGLCTTKGTAGGRTCPDDIASIVTTAMIEARVHLHKVSRMLLMVDEFLFDEFLFSLPFSRPRVEARHPVW
jgi:hypothetical protein